MFFLPSRVSGGSGWESSLFSGALMILSFAGEPLSVGHIHFDNFCFRNKQTLTLYQLSSPLHSFSFSLFFVFLLSCPIRHWIVTLRGLSDVFLLLVSLFPPNPEGLEIEVSLLPAQCLSYSQFLELEYYAGTLRSFSFSPRLFSHARPPSFCFVRPKEGGKNSPSFFLSLFSLEPSHFGVRFLF